MATETTSLDTLTDIKKMMEKSSRFISLSGWSGIVAGVCALAGSFFIRRTLAGAYENNQLDVANEEGLKMSLILIAVGVFVSAFLAAFLFTLFRSRRQGTPIWGTTAKRLLWNTMLPMVVGGLVILHLLNTKNYSLIAPYTLIFYGLALINGSKYTLGEIRYLGYLEIILGLFSLWFPYHWLLWWTIGFGALHIIYGLMMWWKYERK
jgi:hypothetical protein